MREQLKKNAGAVDVLQHRNFPIEKMVFRGLCENAKVVKVECKQI